MARPKVKPDAWRDLGGFLATPVVRAGLAVATGGVSEVVRAGAEALDPRHPHAAKKPRRAQRPRESVYGNRRHAGRLAAGHLPGHVPNAALARPLAFPRGRAMPSQPPGPHVPMHVRPPGRMFPQRRGLGRITAGHKLNE